MKIIKNGKEKVFFEKCTGCATEFEYNYNDIHNSLSGEIEYKMVKCPICSKEVYATLLEKEDYEFYKKFPRYSYFGGKCSQL